MAGGEGRVQVSLHSQVGPEGKRRRRGVGGEIKREIKEKWARRTVARKFCLFTVNSIFPSPFYFHKFCEWLNNAKIWWVSKSRK